MIFRPELVPLVLDGRKTQTRRLGVFEYTPGRDYAVQPGRGKHAVGRIKVTAVRRERLGDISQADALREGFASRWEFIAYWRDLHGSWEPDLKPIVIDFEAL